MYCHLVRGTANAADPVRKLHDQFDGDLVLAHEAVSRRVGDLGAFPDRKTIFLVDPRHSYGSFCPSAGVAIGTPFVRG